jgi:acetyl esterase/lipase
MSVASKRFLAAGILLTFGLLIGPDSIAQAQKTPTIPDDVTFITGIEYANPGKEHLNLNLARPKKGKNPFPAILCIHGGGFRAGKRASYDGLCIRLAQKGYVAAAR